jgi:uncharacterized membrane protein YjjP (DUF1212 family)
MSSEERYDTVLAAAKLLVDSGESTPMTLTAVQRLGRSLGLDAVLIPAWSSLTLIASGSGGTAWVAPVSPTAVNMRRVASMMAVIDRAQDAPLQHREIARGIELAAAEKGVSTPLFAAACATGAVSLALIFGAAHPLALLLVAAGAALGGLLRRWLGSRGGGPLLQVFAAAVIAGLIGAVATTHLQLGASTAMIAVCQATVLVPGPHILNGARDLLDLRVVLGAARLGYAGLVLAAITAGLLFGLRSGGQTVAVTAVPSMSPIYVDVIAAGFAAASFAVLFSMSLRMVGWAVAASMATHALHWWVREIGAGPATAAFVACLFVGVLLVPVSHYLRIPFSAIGFAAVVSFVPGVAIFRTLSGFLQFAADPSPALLSGTISGLVIAATTVVGMALGLALPMKAFGFLQLKRHPAPSA